MKAHQRIVREKMETTAEGDIFGKWWADIDTDIKKAEVREVSIQVARGIIEQYEWMGCLAAVNWYCYGIFFENVCGGVVCYGPEYSENLGKVSREMGRACADWSKYGYEGKMILLNRGACVHWAHPHSASKLIRASMKMLPAKYEVITATVDDLAGEIGTIYQACGFHYVGSMRDANPNVSSRKGDRDAWLINGKLYGSRNIRQKFGTTRLEVVQQSHPDVRVVRQNSKGRYFAFRGPYLVRRAHYDAIAHLIQPFPKRHSQEDERETIACEAGAIPAGRSNNGSAPDA